MVEHHAGEVVSIDAMLRDDTAPVSGVGRPSGAACAPDS
jgi:hypothetical protein